MGYDIYCKCLQPGSFSRSESIVHSDIAELHDDREHSEIKIQFGHLLHAKQHFYYHKRICKLFNLSNFWDNPPQVVGVILFVVAEIFVRLERFFQSLRVEVKNAMSITLFMLNRNTIPSRGRNNVNYLMKLECRPLNRSETARGGIFPGCLG